MMVTVTKWLIIKHMTCVHDLHLKALSHSVAVSIQETGSQLTVNSPYIIVYNKVTVKNTDFQDQS